MIASSDPCVFELRIAVRGRSVLLYGGPDLRVVVPLAVIRPTAGAQLPVSI
jgi:hypothetical protein